MCFYGHCHFHDVKCNNVKCQDGFRCKLGECVQQQFQRRGSVFCNSVGVNIEKKRCDDIRKAGCAPNEKKNVCAFNHNTKTRVDYANYCEACATPSVRLVF